MRLERTTIKNGTRGWPLVAAVALLFAIDGASAQQVPSAPNTAAPVTVRGLAVRIDTLLDLPSALHHTRAGRFPEGRAKGAPAGGRRPLRSPLQQWEQSAHSAAVNAELFPAHL